MKEAGLGAESALHYVGDGLTANGAWCLFKERYGAIWELTSLLDVCIARGLRPLSELKGLKVFCSYFWSDVLLKDMKNLLSSLSLPLQLKLLAH